MGWRQYFGTNPYFLLYDKIFLEVTYDFKYNKYVELLRGGVWDF